MFSTSGIKVLFLDDLSKADEVLRAAGFPEIRDGLVFSVLRYSYWLERKLLEVLRATHFWNRAQRAPKEALDSYALVNDILFFEKSPIERVGKLYSAFQKQPKLALSATAELAVGKYDSELIEAQPHFRAAVKGKFPLVQACFYLEHRARLSILKSAVDLIALDEVNSLARPAVGEGPDLLRSLPVTFRDGMEWLRRQKSFRLYPSFLQVFVWAWGGFILESRRDEEYCELSKQTGIPTEEIPAALATFDKLFPSQMEWISSVRDTQIRILKLVPAAFRGLGAFQRLKRNGLQRYGELGCSDMTAPILTEWHRAAAHLLALRY
jgi:hypothetical protein